MYVYIYIYIYIHTYILHVNQALEALTKFYKKNDVKMGDIQAGSQ